MKFPMQPIQRDASGTARFAKNRIVDDLLEFATARGFGLNQIAIGDYSYDEHMQLAQLIGYSVSGYGDLSYASEESVQKADAIVEELVK